jgi:hypothetical protein
MGLARAGAGFKKAKLSLIERLLTLTDASLAATPVFLSC